MELLHSRYLDRHEITISYTDSMSSAARMEYGVLPLREGQGEE
jgi:hypothetical protein